MTTKFNKQDKVRVSVKDLYELKKKGICDGLDNLILEEKLFGSNLVGEVLYYVRLFTTGEGYNVYCKKPKLGYDRNNQKQVVYGKDFRLGTINFLNTKVN